MFYRAHLFPFISFCLSLLPASHPFRLIALAFVSSVPVTSDQTPTPTHRSLARVGWLSLSLQPHSRCDRMLAALAAGSPARAVFTLRRLAIESVQTA